MAAVQPAVILEAPSVVPRFAIAEFVVRVKEPPFQNPFTDAKLAGIFTDGKASLRMVGFADSPDGSVFRLRFSPTTVGVTYRYELTLKGGAKLTERVEAVRGSADNPMERNEVVAKARDLITPVLGAAKAAMNMTAFEAGIAAAGA